MATVTMNDRVLYTDSSRHPPSTEQSHLISRAGVSSTTPTRVKLIFFLRLAVICMLFICIILEISSNEHTPLLLAHDFYTVITLFWTIFIVLISGSLQLFRSQLWQSADGLRKPFRRMVPLVDAYQSAYLCMVSIWIASWPGTPEKARSKHIYAAAFVLHFIVA